MKPVLGAMALLLVTSSPARAATYLPTAESRITFLATAPIRTEGAGGESHAVQGQIVVPDETLVGITAGLRLPVTSFVAKSGLDQHAFKAVEAAAFPAVMFKSKQVTIATRHATPEGTRLTGTLTGLLNFHGVARPLTATYSALVGPERGELDSEFTVSLTEFGIPRPQIMFVMVDDLIRIGVHVVAQLRP